jgi:hypothetical protein
MTSNMFAAQLAQTATAHRNLEAAADSDSERAHWAGEAERFEYLAKLAETRPEVARQVYRPTRAYEPADSPTS